MEKNFDEWNRTKKGIDNSSNNPIYYQREIWNCYLGINIFNEQNGSETNFIRPVLIFRKFNKNIFWAIPLTRTIKELPFYYTFTTRKEKSTAILSQIRLMDSKRLLNKIGYLEEESFKELKEKFRKLLP